MKLKWYKLWKKSGPNQHYDETYELLEDWRCKEEENLKLIAENWAENVGGGFNTHYSYGFEEVKVPPKEWIDEKIRSMKSNIENLTEQINLYKKFI